MKTTEVQVIKRSELPERELVGADHGGAGVCVIFVDNAPGGGPAQHKHPYEEVFITLEGTATFSIGEGERREVGPGEIVVVPAGVWHGFVNSGDGVLRQIDIHVSPGFDTEWREK